MRNCLLLYFGTFAAMVLLLVAFVVTPATYICGRLFSSLGL